MNGREAVMDFLHWFKGERGDGFVLPDIWQLYQVVDFVDHYNGEHSVQLTVFEAQCAVEGCEATFRTGRSDVQIRRNVRFRRTCRAHKGQFKSPMRGLWSKKGGSMQKVVLKVVEDMALVGPVTERDICRAVAAKLPRGQGKRDERLKRAKRALRGLVGAGRVAPDLTPVPQHRYAKRGTERSLQLA